MTSPTPGQVLRLLGPAPLPSGQKYVVEEIAAGSGSVLRLTVISRTGSKHHIDIFRSAAGRISELIQEWCEVPQPVGPMKAFQLGERAKLRQR